MRDDTPNGEPQEWNPGGIGNAAGAPEAAPVPTWNPGGTGNATEPEAADDSEGADDQADDGDDPDERP